MGIAPQYIELFRILPSIFKVSTPTIQRDCPTMLHTAPGSALERATATNDGTHQNCQTVNIAQNSSRRSWFQDLAVEQHRAYSSMNRPLFPANSCTAARVGESAQVSYVQVGCPVSLPLNVMSLIRTMSELSMRRWLLFLQHACVPDAVCGTCIVLRQHQAGHSVLPTISQ